MNPHPIDLADARQHAALIRVAAQCRIPWTVAVAHAWVSADGETVGVTLRSVDYAQPVRYTIEPRKENAHGSQVV